MAKMKRCFLAWNPNRIQYPHVDQINSSCYLRYLLALMDLSMSKLYKGPKVSLPWNLSAASTAQVRVVGGEFWANSYFGRLVGDKVTTQMIGKYIQLSCRRKINQLANNWTCLNSTSSKNPRLWRWNSYYPDLILQLHYCSLGWRVFVVGQKEILSCR